MRPIFHLNLVLLNLGLLVLPGAAQQDSTCFWQNSGGQTMNLSQLCGKGTPKATGRPQECQTFHQLMKQTIVMDQIIANPATTAQRNRNTQIANKFDRSAATVRTAKFSDPQVKTMQDVTIGFYRGMAKYARIWNQIGAKPNQNQQFVLHSAAKGASLPFLKLIDTYEKTCGQKLVL